MCEFLNRISKFFKVLKDKTEKLIELINDSECVEWMG